MSSHTLTSSLAAAVLALGAVTATSAAQAHSDVALSIGLQVPGLYLQSGPLYAQPRVYYVPKPGYYAPHHARNFSQDFPGNHLGVAPRYGQGYGAGRRPWQRRGSWGDLDRDGVVNWRDHDRDGDGVRNRFDRQPDNPWRR